MPSLVGRLGTNHFPKLLGVEPKENSLRTGCKCRGSSDFRFTFEGSENQDPVPAPNSPATPTISKIRTYVAGNRS